MFDINKFVVLDDKVKLPKSNYIWVIVAFLVLLIIFTQIQNKHKTPVITNTNTNIVKENKKWN